MRVKGLTPRRVGRSHAAASDGSARLSTRDIEIDSRLGNQPIIGQRSGVVRRSKTSRAGRARLGSRRYSASRSSARIRCDSGTGTCSAFERELNLVDSAGTGGCVSRLRLRGREATPSLYAPGYFVSTCPEGYSRSARAGEEGVALCQEVDFLQHVETHSHLEVGCDAGDVGVNRTASATATTCLCHRVRPADWKGIETRPAFCSHESMTITHNLVVILRAEHRQTASGLSETGVAWTSSPRTTEAGKGPAAPGAAEYEEDR